jgi:hypothetical protein
MRRPVRAPVRFSNHSVRSGDTAAKTFQGAALYTSGPAAQGTSAVRAPTYSLTPIQAPVGNHCIDRMLGSPDVDRSNGLDVADHHRRCPQTAAYKYSQRKHQSKKRRGSTNPQDIFLCGIKIHFLILLLVDVLKKRQASPAVVR